MEGMIDDHFIAPHRRAVGDAAWSSLSSPVAGATLEQTIAWALGEQSSLDPDHYAGMESRH
jgi:hypothetical protein